MISVIVTTKDQAHQVERCIDSILRQDFEADFEVIAVDDGSMDGTDKEIHRLFGERVRVLEKKESNGWLPSLATACLEARGGILAVCDPHCTVRPDWLRVIEECFGADPNRSIVTGPAIHGSSFLQKLAAWTVHSQFSSMKRQEVSYIFDDNFAIRKGVLSKLLSDLPLEKDLNDGVGCALLSSQARQEGYSILYEPRMAAVHVTPGFWGYLQEWKEITAPNTVDIRLLAPDVRGAGLMKHLYLAPFLYPAVRILLDTRNLGKLRNVLEIKWGEVPFLLMADVAAKIWYFAGLVQVVRRRASARS